MEAQIQQSTEVQEMNNKQPAIETAASRMESVVLKAGVDKKNVKSTLAQVCGITPQSVHGWFSGSTKNPSAECIASVALHYGSDAVWLITGKPSTERGSSYTETIRYSPTNPSNLTEEEIHCSNVIIKRVFK